MFYLNCGANDVLQVFLSFIMQSAIALLSAIALGLITYRPSSRSAAKFHIESFVAALVDFHKAQCYFSSTIQVTALLLYSQRLPKFQPWAHQLVAQNLDLLDIFELGMLATGALIPINLVSYLVAKHGRQSWCLMFLAAVTSILGTATLASWTRFSTFEHNDSVEIDPSAFPNSARCPGASTASIVTLVTTWCGQRESQLQHLDTFQSSAPWLWAPWTVSCCKHTYAITVHYQQASRRFSSHVTPEKNAIERPQENASSISHQHRLAGLLRGPVLPLQLLLSKWLHLIHMVVWPNHRRHGLGPLSGRVCIHGIL